ncbi:hypothetical protein Naga_101653g2, partial [Nannochloropsis gaditana]
MRTTMHLRRCASLLVTPPTMGPRCAGHQHRLSQRPLPYSMSSSRAWFCVHTISEDEKSGAPLQSGPLQFYFKPPVSSASSPSAKVATSPFLRQTHSTFNKSMKLINPCRLTLRPFFSGRPTSLSSTGPPSSSPPSGPAPPKPTWKELFKKYGPAFLVYWNGVWILSGITIYAALELGGVDPLPLARAVHLDALIDLEKIDPSHGNVAVAILLNEVVEIVRFPFVLATVAKGGSGHGRGERREGGKAP